MGKCLGWIFPAACGLRLTSVLHPGVQVWRPVAKWLGLGILLVPYFTVWNNYAMPDMAAPGDHPGFSLINTAPWSR